MGLAEFRRLLWCDVRGTGHSPPPLPTSAEDLIADVWAVADASGCESLTLAEGSTSASVVLGAALARPARVSSMVLVQPVVEPAALPASAGVLASIGDIARSDWGVFANVHAGMLTLSEADRAEMARVIIEMGSLEAYEALGKITRSLQAPENLEEIEAPTLVLSSQRDRSIVPVEQPREVAARLPEARFTPVERSITRFSTLLDPVRDFLEEVDPSPAAPAAAPAPIEAPPGVRLSPRELEVLKHIAEGKTNAAIAEELVIAPNTVARHVKSILAKTSAANRTEAAMYASRQGLLE